MRRSAAVAVLVGSGVILGATGVSWAVTKPAADRQQPVHEHVLATPESRVSKFYRSGPDAYCDGDSCGIGVVAAKSLVLAGRSSYSGTVFVSLGYSTVGDGKFQLRPLLTNSAGHVVGAVEPAARVIAPTRYPDSTTLAFHVSNLPADKTVKLAIGVQLGRRHADTTSITTSNALVELRVARVKATKVVAAVARWSFVSFVRP